MILEGVDGIVCDLDGVVYRGDDALPGAARAIAALRARGVNFVFCTNNSRSTVDDYVDKLARLGVEARAEQIVTSGLVAASVLERRGMTGARAIVVGGLGVRGALSSIGIVIDDDPASTTADLVVVGWDPGFTYEDMRRASLAVRAGAQFIATNDDAGYPAAGEIWPGAGAILASIEVAAGRRAEVMGKPHDPMMDEAARRLAPADRIAVVGDRPETDLEGGRRRGWLTVLVLSGVTGRADLDALPFRPDLVVDALADLAD